MTEPQSQNQEPLSQVIPVLVAALLCDSLSVDPSSGKKSLIGIFDRLRVAQFPTGRIFTLYAKFTDALGRYHLKVQYVQEASDTVLGVIEAELRASDRTMGTELTITMPAAIAVPAAGRYEFRIFANEVYLGRTYFDAVPRPMATSPL